MKKKPNSRNEAVNHEKPNIRTYDYDDDIVEYKASLLEESMEPTSSYDKKASLLIVRSFAISLF